MNSQLLLFSLYRGSLTISCLIPVPHLQPSDDPMEVNAEGPMSKLGHLSPYSPKQSQDPCLATWLEQVLQSVHQFGIAEKQLPFFLFLLTWIFLIRCLIWSSGISLCFNNTCDKIHLFALKIINSAVHFK